METKTWSLQRRGLHDFKAAQGRTMSGEETYYTARESNPAQFRAYVIPNPDAAPPNSLAHRKFQEKEGNSYYQK